MNDRSGTHAPIAFEALLDGLPSDVAQIARGLRALVLRFDPHAVEVTRLGDRAASYGVGPKKMSEAYAYISPHTHHVNLGFYRGVELPDPAGLLEGTGRAMRHVKIRSLDDIASRGLRQLIEAARDERRGALER